MKTWLQKRCCASFEEEEHKIYFEHILWSDITSSKCARPMKTKSMAKAATLIAPGQTM